MYHNELCNFPSSFLYNRKCDHTCEYWNTCTRKNSYEWQKFLEGVKVSIPTTAAQKQRECMDRNRFQKKLYKQNLLQDINEINTILSHMSKGG